MTGFLDRLPTPVRHAVLVFVGAFVSALLPALTTFAKGDAVDWQSTLVDALGLAVAAVVSAVGLNAALPLDTQYGNGSGGAE